MNGEGDSSEIGTLVDLIDRLISPLEPEPISMGPQTAGWLVVLAALSVVGSALIRWFVRRHRADQYRRDALERLKVVGDDPTKIAEILRRTALAAYPRAQVASLSGLDWLAFLDHTMDGSGFCEGAGQVLAEAPYRRASARIDSLGTLAERWVRTHRQEAGA